MSSKDRKRAVEQLQKIIELSKSIEERGKNPFAVDIDEIISTLKTHFRGWKSFEELCLDAEAVDSLSSIIKLQSDWIKDRSTYLYRDPFLLLDIIKKVSNEKITEVFLGAWHPIVELEQISAEMLLAALKYWKNLLPLDERWREPETISTQVGLVSKDELVKSRILAEKTFKDELNELWNELKHISQEIRYRDFVYKGTFAETVRRAYLTSFLITYGYAELIFHSTDAEIYIKPLQEPKGKFDSKIQNVSIPITISMEDWLKWKENKL